MNLQPSPRPIILQFAGFLGWVVVCFVAAGLGAMASADAGNFYSQLVRPAWAPPGWLFGPVWSALYFAMAVAAWLVWRTELSYPRSVALLLFAIQLLVNALWSWLFFAWHLGSIAFVDVTLLWLLIAGTLAFFWRIERLAGLLLLPYLLWVTFASTLNWVLWQMNPNLLG